MINGIGVDCVDIKRMEKSLARPRFAQRVFSEQERALFATLGAIRTPASAAACFAGKEAFLKAVGVGLGAYALSDIAVLRHPSGAPYYALAGTAAQFCRENSITSHISITHDAGVAIAFTVLEKC